MTRRRSEEGALEALGILALLSRDKKERSERELAEFLSERARKAELTPDEVAGTGMFAFYTLWSRIRHGNL